MYIADYDYDGTNELLIILSNALGTVVTIDELHMLETSKNEPYRT